MDSHETGFVGDGTDPDVAVLFEVSKSLPPNALAAMVTVVGDLLGARSARLLVADYALDSLHELGDHGPTGRVDAVTGTMAGRAFTLGEVVVGSGSSPVVWVPVTEGSERLGVLELEHLTWSPSVAARLGPIREALVLLLASKRRYTDVLLRSRRRQPLSLAAEMQWDLLPPLACSTPQVSVSGILEPAYSIGGDSFDYAVNPGGLDFAIIDAVGHGTAAVLMSVVAVNSLRNARREGAALDVAYHDTGRAMETQFGGSAFVTGQMGSLAVETGHLRWINAGHPLPILVRDGAFVGELGCRPSLPMGLGGRVVEEAVETLQKGDRVLFFTDGVLERRSPEGADFGLERLADLLVRATLDAVPPAETVRRLAGLILEFNGEGLADDATLLLLEYHGSRLSVAEVPSS